MISVLRGIVYFYQASFIKIVIKVVILVRFFGIFKKKYIRDKSSIICGLVIFS